MISKTLVALGLLLALAGTALGVETAAHAKFDSSQPVTITSKSLEADQAARRVQFHGDVVARQGNVVIYAQQLTVFYKQGKGDGTQIDHVVAEKDVRIVQGAKVATGQKAVFYESEGRIVLTGSPKVHQGEDFVEGDEITVFLNQDRSIVKSEGNSRVNAVFHPKEKSH